MATIYLVNSEETTYMLKADELKYDVDALTNVMMAWMMSSNFDKFHQQCEQLLNGLVKYNLSDRDLPQTMHQWNHSRLSMTMPYSIVATASIVHFKKSLCTAHFEAALTFNQHC